jgi:hypothetical protein
LGEAEAVSEIIREENTGRDMLGITDSRESEEDRYEYRSGMGSRSRGVTRWGCRDSPVTYDKQKKRTAIASEPPARCPHAFSGATIQSLCSDPVPRHSLLVYGAKILYRCVCMIIMRIIQCVRLHDPRPFGHQTDGRPSLLFGNHD